MNWNWVHQNLQWIIPLTVAVLGVVGTLLRGVFSKRQPTSITQEASPSITQNANPTTNIYIGQPLPAPAVPSTAPDRTVRPEPNLIFLRSRTAFVEIGLNDGLYERDYATGFAAVVACFRNEPIHGKRVSDSEYVTASLIYRRADGQEIGEGISRACWLNDEHDMVDFDVGQSHCAILVVHAAQGLFVPYKRRKETGFGNVLLSDAFEFKEEISTIEVRLMGSRNELLLEPMLFEFSLLEGVPRAVQRC